MKLDPELYKIDGTWKYQESENPSSKVDVLKAIIGKLYNPFIALCALFVAFVSYRTGTATIVDLTIVMLLAMLLIDDKR